MDFEFSIHFGKSRSSEYDNVIEYASMFEKFTPIGPESTLNVIETNNHELLEKYHLFQILMDTTKDWDQVGVSFRNKEIDLYSFYLIVKEVVGCYKAYVKSDDKMEYCCDEKSNCWGCRQLNEIILHHIRVPYSNHVKYWYQYGAFTSKSTWQINKEDLARALEQTVEKKNIDFCPIFQQVFYRRIVAALPSTIDVSDTKNWGLIYLDDSLSNSKVWEPISIFHKASLSSQGSDGFTPETLGVVTARKKHAKVEENINLRYVPDISFADIGGIDEIIQNIRTVIELPMKRPDLYQHMGIKPYRGILLWGDPGNGKTLIAKAVAHEVNAHFIPICGPDFFDKGFGESEKNLRDIFDEARKLQPTIIFFDEIDSIAQTRLAGETAKWYATVVNQLMSLMDGIHEFGNVTVLASTNRPDLLDSALLRPGRFDFKIEVKKPNLPGCKKILEIATRGMPLAEDVDLFVFAESVVGYSGAEITFIAKEAAMAALKRSIDVKAVLNVENAEIDYSQIQVNLSDFFNALLSIKWNSKYINKTYTLKG